MAHERVLEALQGDLSAVSALRVLQLYYERMGCTPEVGRPRLPLPFPLPLSLLPLPSCIPVLCRAEGPWAPAPGLSSQYSLRMARCVRAAALCVGAQAVGRRAMV